MKENVVKRIISSIFDFLTNSSKSLIKGFTIYGRNYKISSVCQQESGDNYSIRLKFYGKIPQSIHQEEVKKLEIYLEDNIEELDEVIITASIGKKPRVPTFPNKTKTWQNKWYTKPTFLLSLIAVVTTGTIIYIIKKTR